MMALLNKLMARSAILGLFLSAVGYACPYCGKRPCELNDGGQDND